MALTLPPTRTKKEAASEADIEAMINRGGEVAVSKEAPPAEVDPNTVRHVNARLTEAIIRQIDTLRAARTRKIGSPKMGVSLRDWVVEAVMEKLERDTKKLQQENKGGSKKQ